MLPQNNPDRIRVVFDDHRLVANAGLLLPATLAQPLNHLPSGRFAANGAWLAVQVMAHKPRPLDSAHRSGRTDRDHQDPQAAGLRSGGTDHPLGAPPYPASSPALALGNPVHLAPWPGCEPFHSPPDCQPATDPTSLQTRATPVRESSLLRILSPSRASQLPQRAIGALYGD